MGANGVFERQRAAHRLPATVLAVSRAVVHRSGTKFDEEISTADEHVRADGHRHYDRCPCANRAARSGLRVGGMEREQPSALNQQPFGKESGHLVASRGSGKRKGAGRFAGSFAFSNSEELASLLRALALLSTLLCGLFAFSCSHLSFLR